MGNHVVEMRAKESYIAMTMAQQKLKAAMVRLLQQINLPKSPKIRFRLFSRGKPPFSCKISASGELTRLSGESDNGESSPVSEIDENTSIQSENHTENPKSTKPSPPSKKDQGTRTRSKTDPSLAAQGTLTPILPKSNHRRGHSANQVLSNNLEQSLAPPVKPSTGTPSSPNSTPLRQLGSQKPQKTTHHVLPDPVASSPPLWLLNHWHIPGAEALGRGPWEGSSAIFGGSMLAEGDQRTHPAEYKAKRGSRIKKRGVSRAGRGAGAQG